MSINVVDANRVLRYIVGFAQERGHNPAFDPMATVVRAALRLRLWHNRVRQTESYIEWDGWGGVPVGDWTAYVVFDPNDSLSLVPKPFIRQI
jgi:hypothetical protein